MHVPAEREKKTVTETKKSIIDRPGNRKTRLSQPLCVTNGTERKPKRMGWTGEQRKSLIGRVCAATGASSYGDAWAKTVGEKTSWLPTSSCTAKTFFACMAYSIIVGT